MTKVAFITGASRGIGKACAHRFARAGYNVVIAAKTTEENPKLPGTIFTAADEVARHGTEVLPVRCDVTDLQSVQQSTSAALWWKTMDETPMKRFDLMMNVNARGAFAVTSAFLPAMKEQRLGHVIFMSPPIAMEMLPGHIGYCISKFGMTMMAHGIPQEFGTWNIRATALWPKTLIESYATINFQLGDPSVWRKADILADASYEIVEHPELSDGKALIDEDFLREIGYTDFDRYLCVPGGVPRAIS
jgi:citronellol/citronellal dehydrogenase